MHVVTTELDAGPLVLQARLPVHQGETAAELAARVQTAEHQIYPQAAAMFADGRLGFKDESVYLDGERLEQPIIKDFD